MLFLVISAPGITRPADARDGRRRFRSWIASLRAQGSVLTFYPLAGRGSVIIFDVPTNEALHALLTRWADIVPASFDIRVLVEPAAAERLLD
jgi:muconolactone delta-isomerase